MRRYLQSTYVMGDIDRRLRISTITIKILVEMGILVILLCISVQDVGKSLRFSERRIR